MLFQIDNGQLRFNLRVQVISYKKHKVEINDLPERNVAVFPGNLEWLTRKQ